MTAPAATPKDIIHKLADANKKALKSPEIPEGAGRPGLSHRCSAPAEKYAFRADQVIKEIGLDKDKDGQSQKRGRTAALASEWNPIYP